MPYLSIDQDLSKETTTHGDEESKNIQESNKLDIPRVLLNELQDRDDFFNKAIENDFYSQEYVKGEDLRSEIPSNSKSRETTFSFLT